MVNLLSVSVCRCWNKCDLEGENEAEEIIVNDSISQHFTTAHYRNGSSFKHITSMSDVNLKCDKCIVPNLITPKMCENKTDDQRQKGRERQEDGMEQQTCIINDHKPKMFSDVVSFACIYATIRFIFLFLFIFFSSYA